MKSRLKLAAGEVLRATIIVASVCAILGVLSAIPELTIDSRDVTPPLYERVFMGFIVGSTIGAAFGAAAGIFIAVFNFVKSFFPTT